MQPCSAVGLYTDGASVCCLQVEGLANRNVINAKFSIFCIRKCFHTIGTEITENIPKLHSY